MTSRLNAEYLQNETQYRQLGPALETIKDPLQSPEIV